MAQKMEAGLGKYALVEVDKEVIVAQDGEELLEVYDMILKGGAGH